MSKACENCGKKFPAKYNKKYCCDSCRDEKKKKDYQESKHVMKYTGICAVCGKEFPSPKKLETCSNDCRRILRARRNIETRKRNKALKQNTPKPLTVDEQERRARDAGLSYGQYEALRYTNTKSEVV